MSVPQEQIKELLSQLLDIRSEIDDLGYQQLRDAALNEGSSALTTEKQLAKAGRALQRAEEALRQTLDADE